MDMQGIMHALEAMSMHFVVDRPLLAIATGPTRIFMFIWTLIRGA